MSAILDTLEQLYITRESEVERFFARARAEAAPFVTTSVDLRHSGLRLAPVDTNLYPAGFNNLSVAAELRAARYLQHYMEDHHAGAKRLLIVPENHTRNLSYLDSLVVLKRIAEASGFEVEIGNLSAEPGAPVKLISRSGHELTQQPLTRDGATLKSESGFTPDVILLNNDCTSGPPPLLENIAQPVMPPVEMGWYRRRKSTHFSAYRELAQAFAAEFNLDPWLLAADFHRCGMIDFKAREGLDCLAKAVDAMITTARAKHSEYGINDDPYIYMKADGGTYGMGIMVVRSGTEIMEMNKKDRNKMQVIKEGARVSEVILQEGIPTIDRVQGAPAEPMIYLVDGIPAGGMFRFNPSRDALGNLNAAGMEFTGMCDETEMPENRQPVRACHFRAFGLIAALAALAAGREKAEQPNFTQKSLDYVARTAS